MMMRGAALLLVCLMLQAATPGGATYYSGEELKAEGRKLGAASKHQGYSGKDLERYGNHYTMLAHRESSGRAEIHVHDSDLFLVVEGEATIVTGGTIANSKMEQPGEIRGTSITGGERRKLAAGDVIHIAPNTPHQLLIEHGKALTYFVMKVTSE
jgi:mannose-6-phosphate isomerase-like protein (cupin superfamily)